MGCDGCQDAWVYPCAGAVIVGSVDGNRIWGKELKGVTLTHAEVDSMKAVVVHLLRLVHVRICGWARCGAIWSDRL